MQVKCVQFQRRRSLVGGPNLGCGGGEYKMVHADVFVYNVHCMTDVLCLS